VVSNASTLTADSIIPTAGILAWTEKNVTITIAQPLILSNEMDHVGIVVIAKLSYANTFIPKRLLSLVSAALDANYGRVPNCILSLELDYARVH
jgi:hypothetical protein